METKERTRMEVRMNWPAGEEARRQEDFRSCTNEDGRIIDLKRLKEIQLAAIARKRKYRRLMPDEFINPMVENAK